MEKSVWLSLQPEEWRYQHEQGERKFLRLATRRHYNTMTSIVQLKRLIHTNVPSKKKKNSDEIFHSINVLILFDIDI